VVVTAASTAARLLRYSTVATAEMRAYGGRDVGLLCYLKLPLSLESAEAEDAVQEGII